MHQFSGARQRAVTQICPEAFTALMTGENSAKMKKPGTCPGSSSQMIG
jgi:hypothetical protein